MRPAARGRPALAALCLLIAAPAAAGDMLHAVGPDGRVLARLPFPRGAEVCLRWAHSVTGGAVADCFRNRDGRMVLARSYLHDYAAGLGEVQGRGTLRPADDGGYWITGIDEVMPRDGLPLRVGPPRVGHRLQGAGQKRDLSAVAANRRVLLRVVPD